MVVLEGLEKKNFILQYTSCIAGWEEFYCREEGYLYCKTNGLYCGWKGCMRQNCIAIQNCIATERLGSWAARSRLGQGAGARGAHRLARVGCGRQLGKRACMRAGRWRATHGRGA